MWNDRCEVGIGSCLWWITASHQLVFDPPHVAKQDQHSLVFDFELFIGDRFDLLSNAGELFTKSDEQGMYTSVGPNRRSSRAIQ